MNNTGPAKRPPTRREFFPALARWGALAALAALATAVTGTSRSSRQGGKCINRGVCSGCGVFDGCGLPQALSAKQHDSRR